MFLQFSIHIQPKTQNSKPAQAQRLCVVLSTQTTSKNSVQLCPKTRLLFEKIRNHPRANLFKVKIH